MQINHFQASRYHVEDHLPVTLTWATQGADRVILLPEGIEGDERDSFSVSPEEDTKYILKITNSSGGEVEQTLTITVVRPKPEILYAYVHPKYANIGDEIQLRWKVIGAREVLLDRKPVGHRGNKFVRNRQSAKHELEVRCPGYAKQRHTFTWHTNRKVAPLEVSMSEIPLISPVYDTPWERIEDMTRVDLEVPDYLPDDFGDVAFMVSDVEVEIPEIPDIAGKARKQARREWRRRKLRSFKTIIANGLNGIGHFLQQQFQKLISKKS